MKYEGRHRRTARLVFHDELAYTCPRCWVTFPMADVEEHLATEAATQLDAQRAAIAAARDRPLPVPCDPGPPTVKTGPRLLLDWPDRDTFDAAALAARAALRPLPEPAVSAVGLAAAAKVMRAATVIPEAKPWPDLTPEGRARWLERALPVVTAYEANR